MKSFRNSNKLRSEERSGEERSISSAGDVPAAVVERRPVKRQFRLLLRLLSASQLFHFDFTIIALFWRRLPCSRVDSFKRKKA